MKLDMTRYEQSLALAVIHFDWDPLQHPRDVNGRWKDVTLGTSKLGDVLDRETTGLPDNTQDLHTHRDEHGQWRYTKERKAWQDKLIWAMLGPHKDEQAKPTALFTAGGAGSGKTTAMEQKPDLAPDDHVLIDPDAIMEQIPEYRQLTIEGDPRAAALVHDEAIDIAQRLLATALRDKYNFVMDGTGASPAFLDRLNRTLDEGYETNVVYFTTDTDTALERVVKRKAETGRGVNVDVARDMHRNASRLFEDVYDLGVPMQLYDTTGETPELFASAEGGADLEIHDEDALNAFLEKAHEKPSWQIRSEAKKAAQAAKGVTV